MLGSMTAPSFNVSLISIVEIPSSLYKAVISACFWLLELWLKLSSIPQIVNTSKITFRVTDLPFSLRRFHNMQFHLSR